MRSRHKDRDFPYRGRQRPLRRSPGSRRRIAREVRAPATRHGVSAVYLLRSAQYQFCNCGVLCIHACRGRLALNQLWDRGGNMAKKAKKAKKKTGKKKKK